MNLSTLLIKLEACDEARKWAKPYAALQEAWDVCPRADWMLWLLEATESHAEERRTLAYAFADRAVRVHAVAALRSAGLTTEADRLAALPPIVDKETATAARVAAGAAWDAAWDAAWAAENKLQADTIRALIPTPEVTP